MIIDITDGTDWLIESETLLLKNDYHYLEQNSQFHSQGGLKKIFMELYYIVVFEKITWMVTFIFNLIF